MKVMGVVAATLAFALVLWVFLFAPASTARTNDLTVPHVAYHPSPTLPMPFAATPQAAQAAAQATIMAGQAAVVNLNITATAVGLHMAQARATENAAALATAMAMQGTATAQVQQVTATAQAATATAQALAFQGTATAQAQQVTATAQALANNGTATAQALMAQATALAAQAEREQLAVEQQRMMNTVWAVTKWAVPVLLFLLLTTGGVILAREWAKLRVVRREDGKVLVFVHGRAVYDPDRNPTPVLQVGPDGQVALPPVSEDTQAATTARDQAIALARATGRKPPARAMATQTPPVRFRVIQPGERPPVQLDADTVGVLEAQWREADGD